MLAIAATADEKTWGTTGNSICLGQRRHLAADGDAAGPDHVGLDDVDRALGDQIAETGETGRGLVAGHRHVERVRDLRAAGHVVGGDRLLQPVDILVGHRGA